MPQDPRIARAMAAQEPQQTGAVSFDAQCPNCPPGINARWRAVAVTTGDHTRTRVDYLITCAACPPSVEEAKEIA